MKENKTSWSGVGGWYSALVGISGHYYHKKVILPNLMRLMELKPEDKVADLGCGEGILARLMPNNYYWGIDVSRKLIEEAKKKDNNSKHRFVVGDITQKLEIREKFSKAVMLLSLQNIKRPFKAIQNAAEILADGGELFVVLNHPCFRIPQHSDWETDRSKKTIWRKEDRYLSPLEIKIESSPFNQKNQEVTYSYHYPLSAYSQMFRDNGMVIEGIEEWVSDKKSEGGMAKLEDEARRQFPLFLMIKCRLRV
jgi:ubiquinone/menaquinone biosynthesis C-methylase UbiE